MLKNDNHYLLSSTPVYAENVSEGNLLDIAEITVSEKRVGRPKKLRTEWVIKSDGHKERFDVGKIEKSIITAGRDTKEYSKKEAGKILKRVLAILADIEKVELNTVHIRSVVEPIIADEGYFKTARYYILYKERKEQKKKVDFEIWEPEMNENSRITLVSKCAMHDDKGNPEETPGQIFWRVARALAKAEINWGDEKDVERAAQTFFTKMADFKFICTRSAMYEAGNDSCSQQLSPCFVLPIEDSIGAIFKTLGEAALVQKNYGGTGFNFSNIRFKGDKVRSVVGAASGPVDFLQAYSAALSKVIQGAKRHGGNMGILNVDHPDIYEFIRVKDVDGTMKNFNISVGVTNEFMEAVVQNRKFALKNPRNGEVVKMVNAKELFDEICEHAWLTGDPGMIFLDKMEEDNYTPTLGKLNATNPCGEQPLLPYESCNLSSINLVRHLVEDGEKWQIDWDDLADTTKTVVRFLDNMIESNYYVLADTERLVKHGNRKIGVGMIGFGELLYKLKIPYNSTEGVRIADKIAKFVKRTAEEASSELAKTRGVFPNWDISTYKGTAEKYRNCTMITIAPTGTVSMIGDTTSSVEPYFALVYTRRSFYDGDSSNNSTHALYYIVPEFEKALKDNGMYSDELIKKIADNHGSIQSLKEIPEDLKKVFVTTHDIDPEWHVRIQAAFQNHADNAVSKTINFANSATVKDVERAYLLAWKTGCKGITIYRDGSKVDQVLSTGISKKASSKNDKSQIKSQDVQVKTCPECEGKSLLHESGCVTCRDCGWSECKI